MAGRSQPRADGFHLFNLAALRLDDFAAQVDQFLILEVGLASHENGPGMMRDHAVDELTVVN